MADTIDISAVARVVDQASPSLKAIRASTAAVGTAAKTSGAALASLGARGAFGGITANLRNVGGVLGRMGGALKSAIAPLGAVLGLAGIGGAVAAMRSFVSEGDKLYLTAQRLGVSAEDLQKFRFVADQAGVSTEEFDKSLQIFMKTLGKVKAGGKAAASAGALLKKFGVTMDQIKTGDISTILPQLAVGFEKNKTNIVDVNRALTELFGKGGPKLFNMYTSGKVAMQDLMAEAVKLGIITNEEAEQANAAQNAWGKMDQALKGLKNTIAVALLPAVERGVKWITEWIKANREWLKTEITEAVKSLGRWLKSINWTAIGEGIKTVWRIVDTVVKAFGGWKVAIVAMIAVLNPLSMALIKLGAAIFTAFGPWGLLALAAVAAAALIYTNWDKIGPWFDANVRAPITKALGEAEAAFGDWLESIVPQPVKDAWTKVADAVDEAMNPIRQTLDSSQYDFEAWLASATPEPVKTGWSNFAEWLDNDVMSGVKRILEADGETWKQWMRDVAPDTVKAAWGGFSEWLAGNVPGPEQIKAAWGDFGAWFGTDVVAPAKEVWSTLAPAFDAVWKEVSRLFDAAKSMIQSAVAAITKFLQPLFDLLGRAGSAIAGAASTIAGILGIGGGAAAAGGGAGSTAPAAPPEAGLAGQAAAQQGSLVAQQAETLGGAWSHVQVDSKVQIGLADGLVARNAQTNTTGAERGGNRVDVGNTMMAEG